MIDRAGQRLGNYRLIRLLGRGGFAEVYLGEHLRLGIQAAVKVFYARLANSNEVESFQQETRTIAQLEHPHIVRVFDFDVVDDTPFLVMDYAANGTLRMLHPKGTVLPFTTIIAYVKQVADGLQYAHDQRLIHRAVKPENMLIGEHDELLLSDFGIAIVAQSSRYQSMQDMVGTMGYMAPEQIQGNPRPASDQYSLGIVVYEWLSGDRPFQGSITEIEAQHLAVPPPSLCEKHPTISPAVEQVVLKTLAKDPRQRFASVQDFASALEQAWQSEAASIFEVVSLPSPPESLRPADVRSVTRPAQSVVSPTRRTSRRAVLVGLGLAGLAVAGGGATWLVLSRKPPVGTTLYTYGGHSGVVATVAWSPDGQRIASGSTDGTVQVWDASNGGNAYAYHGHASSVNAVAWSPDGQRITSGSTDGTVQVWDASNGGNAYTYHGHAGFVNAVAWSPDGKYIASGSSDQTVQVWDASNGGNAYTYRGHAGFVNAVAWSPDGKYIASASTDQTVQVWDASNGGNAYTYRGHAGFMNAVAWSPDGKYIASASTDQTVQVWDASNGGNAYTYHGHAGFVNAVAWSPDGKYIVSGSSDRTVQVWGATSGGHIYTYRGHAGFVNAVAWSPNGKYIASGSSDQTVQVWNAP